jgi:hypothetical protein
MHPKAEGLVLAKLEGGSGNALVIPSLSQCALSLCLLMVVERLCYFDIVQSLSALSSALSSITAWHIIALQLHAY